MDLKLREELLETLEDRAEQEGKDVNDILNAAVEHYLLKEQRDKLDQEISAYQTMYPDLLKKYPQQWVAIHNRELVDHDIDGLALYNLVRKNYGLTSVLIRNVSDERNYRRRFGG